MFLYGYMTRGILMLQEESEQKLPTTLAVANHIAQHEAIS